jgi:hypothetical protein
MSLFEVDLSKVIINSRFYKPEAVTESKNVMFVTAESKNVTNFSENIVENQSVIENVTKITNVTEKNHNIGKIKSGGDWHELFEERAAIREYEGGLSRLKAEVSTFNELVYRFCDENNCDDTDFAVDALLASGLKNPYRKPEYNNKGVKKDERT